MNIVSGGSIIATGKVTQEPVIRHTKSGKSVTGFAMSVGSHYNEDGKAVNDYMNVSVWGDEALLVGDHDTGLEKYDTVLVAGTLVRDKFKEERYPTGEPQYLSLIHI